MRWGSVGMRMCRDEMCAASEAWKCLSLMCPIRNDLSCLVDFYIHHKSQTRHHKTTKTSHSKVKGTEMTLRTHPDVILFVSLYLLFYEFSDSRRPSQLPFQIKVLYPTWKFFHGCGKYGERKREMGAGGVAAWPCFGLEFNECLLCSHPADTGGWRCHSGGGHWGAPGGGGGDTTQVCLASQGPELQGIIKVIFRPMMLSISLHCGVGWIGVTGSICGSCFSGRVCRVIEGA